MIIHETCRSEIEFFCPLCGTNNITNDAKITHCPHFEGIVAMSEIQYDKNGLLEKADNKSNEIFEKVLSLVNKKSKNVESEFEKIKTVTDESRSEYRTKINTIIKECYVEVGWPLNVPVNQINGTNMIDILDVLKTQLDDSYIAFYSYAPAPDGSDGFNLYHLVDFDDE